MKNKKINNLKIFLFVVFLTTCDLQLVTYNLFAQDDNKLVTLTKQLIEAKKDLDAYETLEALKVLYLSDHKYTEFVEFLESLIQQKKTLEPFVNYYIGLSRYEQLKYLEETQNWNEYFNNGPAFREELVKNAQKAIDSSTEPLNLYSSLLLWQFHKDQEDASWELALSDLMKSVLDYAKESQDPKPIKDIADKLLEYGQKGKAKELYKVYVNKIATADISDNKLKDIALGFQREGNLELAQSIYDVYLERITKKYPKEKSIPILKDIVKSFSYYTAEEMSHIDAFYAEKLFKKIEELGKKETFDEELMYLRAFNFEKTKEYSKAKDVYVELVSRFPDTTHTDEARFKVGIVYTYILKDVKTGRDYFEGLAQKETLSPEGILSLYQLGLLSQWENDFFKARDYYNKVLQKAGDDFSETVALTKERLRELTEIRPIEYNLKMFLDVSLKKEENAVFDASKVDLKSFAYRLTKNQDATISATLYNIETGCMQVQVQYLWSGDTGTTKPSIEQSTFNTTYTQTGTKVMNLVVVSPAGVIDRTIEILDVY